MTDLVERMRDIKSGDPRTVACELDDLCQEAATALEAKDKELAAFREENDHLTQFVHELQCALMFWMPVLDVRLDEPARELASKDALLLAGYDGPIDGACWGDEVLARAETSERRVKSRDTCQDAAFAKLLDRKNELAKLLETAERELEREREAFQRHEQTLRDNGIASHSEAVVLVTTLRQVFEDVLDELGCERDNDSALEAIATLRRERDEARAALKPMIPLAEDTAKKLRQCGSPMADQIEKLARAARAITGEK